MWGCCCLSNKQYKLQASICIVSVTRSLLCLLNYIVLLVMKNKNPWVCGFTVVVLDVHSWETCVKCSVKWTWTSSDVFQYRETNTPINLSASDPHRVCSMIESGRRGHGGIMTSSAVRPSVRPDRGVPPRPVKITWCVWTWTCRLTPHWAAASNLFPTTV